MNPVVDVAVIGGGPSGSAAARLLASWGHSVLLLTKPFDRARGLAESLPPSTRKLLAEIGVVDDVDRAGFYRTTGNTVWWGEREGHVENFGGSGDLFGYQVFRPDFDRLLLESAERAGALVVRDGAVRRVDLNGDGVARVEGPEGDLGWRSLTARFVLDCSGRAGVIARNGFRRYEPGYRMQALIGVWDQSADAGWGLPDDTHTIVETYEDGWAWSVPVSPQTRHVGLVVDGRTSHVQRGPTIESTYRTEMAKTRQLNELMAAATLDRVWACDASLYSSHTYAGPCFLLVGDAGSFIDPLSSFGVKKSLASAWVGAIAVHTCLEHPERTSVALDFYSRREREVYATTLARSREYSREAYGRHPHPFWAERAGGDLEPAAEEIDEHVLFRAPEVQAAFQQLKESASIELVEGSAPRVTRAMIRGHEIVLAEAVTFAEAPDGIRFLAGVDLLKLCEMACRHRQVPDLFESYCRTHGAVPLPSLLGSLSVLVAKGILTTRTG